MKAGDSHTSVRPSSAREPLTVETGETGETGARNDVFVVGSINHDYVLSACRRPAPGETIGGATLTESPGGKGANQAIAVAQLGASVALLGRVGRDPLGGALLERLAREGVDTAFIVASELASTGVAFITVTPDGENTVVVVPGANATVSAHDVERAAGAISSARTLLLQLEIPLPTVERAVAAAASETRVVLNASPVVALPDGLLGRLDVMVANEQEASTLAGRRIGGPREAIAAARQLRARGPRSVVVTLGAKGAIWVDEGSGYSPAPAVNVVDTTGAGDAFLGALAVSLCSGAELEDAVDLAVHAGAIAVQYLGAQRPAPASGSLSGRPS